MDHNPEIINLSNQLAQAVEAALNPEVPQDKRHEAYNACEEFKEKSPFCIQCSVYLALNGSDLVRHFGLQLMEYCVKYKWYDMDQPSKITFKDVTMSLLHSCEGDIRQHIHLRDALSRVIVEMVKREWPQQWPNLLPELFETASKGHIQAEIVLLTLLRFVEDIVVLQTLEYAQRRKDLYQHFMLQLESVFTFLLNLMAHHYEMCNILESVRIINVTLKLLSEIVEFAFINRLVAEEQRILPVLCNFLTEENFQLEAAECLNRIATKKGKPEDRRTICRLLVNSSLITSISRLNFLLLCNGNGGAHERGYAFLKKVSELLLSLCTLLCAVVKNAGDNVHDLISAENFILFLEILISLCNHASYAVAFNANACWNQLFKHNIFSKNNAVLNYVTKWVSGVTPKLIKMPFNCGSVTTPPLFQECYRYLIYDFDSEDAFATFYFRFRVELLEAFRHLTAIAPAVTFGCVEHWLNTRIQKSTASPAVGQEDRLEWEAIGVLLETIVSNLPKSHDVTLERSIRMLDLCLSYKPTDVSVVSLLLSCVSALTYFVNGSPEEVRAVYVPRILELIFACLVFEAAGESKFARSRKVRDLRKHAGCLFVKISQKYPFLFLPFYDHIRKVYVDLKNDPNRLNKMESVLFLESLLLIGNSFGDYARQSRFVQEVFEPVHQHWMKLATDVLGDWTKFAAYVGLHAKGSGSAQIVTRNRSELMYCVEMTAAVLKRCTWPESKEVALKGGYVAAVGGFEQSSPVYKNPCTPHVVSVLPYVFSLIKTVHSLWSPEAKAKLPAGYEKIHEPSAVEIRMLFGSHLLHHKTTTSMADDAKESRSEYTRLQSFVVNLYELCFSILTKACQNLGSSLYELPNFAPSFAASVFHQLDFIPDNRLRVMVKVFLKPFVYCCPADKYDSILLPICGYFSNYMVQRLSTRWKYLKECHDSGKINEESGEDCKELIEDFLNTQLSREYMDVVKSMMLKLNVADLKQSNGFGNSNEEGPSPTGSQTNLHYASNMYDNLSDLGIKLLRYEMSRFGILNFLLNAISWTDSTNSLKATFKMPAVVKQLLADGNITQEIAGQILIGLLQGLQLHGQHDANQGSLLNCSVLVYQLLRPTNPPLLEILSMVPNVNLEDLQKFDQKILNVALPEKVDKGMKDMFRKLVNNLIGRNIGQLFKRKETIRDLPRIEIPRPKGENILNTSGNENDIGIANFFR